MKRKTQSFQNVCPRCGNPLKKGGKIKASAGVNGKSIQVWVCWRCGYRTTGDNE